MEEDTEHKLLKSVAMEGLVEVERGTTQHNQAEAELQDPHAKATMEVPVAALTQVEPVEAQARSAEGPTRQVALDCKAP